MTNEDDSDKHYVKDIRQFHNYMLCYYPNVAEWGDLYD